MLLCAYVRRIILDRCAKIAHVLATAQDLATVIKSQEYARATQDFTEWTVLWRCLTKFHYCMRLMSLWSGVLLVLIQKTKRDQYTSRRSISEQMKRRIGFCRFVSLHD